MTDRPGWAGAVRRGVSAVGIGLILSLTSCLGIEAAISLNDNGSGKVVYQYRVSKMFVGLKKSEGGPKKPDLPLPVSRQDLERTLAKARGVISTGVEQSENDTEIILKGEIRFDSVAALNRSGFFDDYPITLSREGGRTLLTLLLSDAREPLDEASRDVYDNLFAGYGLVLKITAPKEIVSPAPDGGSLSADKKTLTYAVGLADLMRLSDKTQLRVGW